MTAFDNITRYLSGPMRRVTDYITRHLSTQVCLLRIRIVSDNVEAGKIHQGGVLGSYGEELDVSVITVAEISYPFSDLETFLSPKTDSYENVVTAIKLDESLPVKVRVPFHGDRKIEATELKTNDLVVDVLFDHHETPIPVIFQVSTAQSWFFGKEIVGLEHNLSLYRGTLSTEIKQVVDGYVYEVVKNR